MFRNAIEGINEIFKGDIGRGKLILVTGGPGTLKSAFIHTLLLKHVTSVEEYGLYITLEETKNELMENLQSLGIKSNPKLHVSDYTEIREDLDAKGENVDYAQLIEQTVELFKDDVGASFSCLAIDSLNSLYSLMEIKNLRKTMFRFFRKLKNMKLTTFIIKENAMPGTQVLDGGEEYLADGMVELGTIETYENVTRYIQVKKMRGTSHSMKKFQIEVGNKGLSIVGEAYSIR
jgi:KaiC/GvpD/RAD55 family RecA-like ATPase